LLDGEGRPASEFDQRAEFGGLRKSDIESHGVARGSSRLRKCFT
jgi:hypothetical protein